jgi:alpha-tubulin suppressor-like RCC1 family protein
MRMERGSRRAWLAASGATAVAMLWAVGTAGAQDPAPKHKVLEVAAGKISSCALLDDGTVRCWGTAQSGVLGDGKNENEAKPPVQVQGITAARHVFRAGESAFCAQTADGKVLCWGASYNMPLEKGQGIVQAIEVPALAGVKKVASSHNGFNCAILADGSVGCWGRGAFGRMGVGSDADQRLPAAVAGVSNAVDIGVGQNHTCVATQEGKVWCWGYNSSGQVDPAAENRDPVKTPVEVAGVADAVAVGVGGSTSCAILKDGSTLCWGSDFHKGPKPFEALTAIRKIDGSSSHLCAITADGALHCWGNNYHGQLGAGLEAQSSSKPVAVQGLTQVVSVSAGDGLTCAATAAGDLSCWGKNDKGQLGHTRVELARAPEALAYVRAGLADLEQNFAKAEQFLADERAALTPEKYEELFLAMADCELSDSGIDSKCEAKKAYDQARSRNTALKDLAGMTAGLGQKHIGHASPAIRFQAASIMGSIFGANPESQRVLLAAAAKEPDPLVLRSMLRAVGSSLAKNEGVYQLVLHSAGHKDEKVRLEALGSLTAWGREREGAIEKVMHAVENDAVPRVSQYACENLGRMEDERALPFYEKLTASADTDPELYAACMKGLFKMWSGVTKPKNPSEKAYRLTLERVAAEPRSEHRPPRSLMSDFGWSVPSRPDDKFHQEWAAKATWYKNDEVIGVLEKIVRDRQSSWMARTGAVEAMHKLGAPKATFETLAEDYADADGKPGTDSHVLRKLKEVASKN